MANPYSTFGGLGNTAIYNNNNTGLQTVTTNPFTDSKIFLGNKSFDPQVLGELLELLLEQHPELKI